MKNKRNQAVAEMLAEMGCYPAQGLARIAQNPKFPVEIRAKCYADLMRYVHPQLSAVDQHVTGNVGTTLIVTSGISRLPNDPLLPDAIDVTPALPPADGSPSIPDGTPGAGR